MVSTQLHTVTGMLELLDLSMKIMEWFGVGCCKKSDTDDEENVGVEGVISPNDHRSQCLLSFLNISVLCSIIFRNKLPPSLLSNKYSLVCVEFLYNIIYIYSLCAIGVPV